MSVLQWTTEWQGCVEYEHTRYHTLLHFTSLGSGSVIWTMLCEGEGWGKGKVPWNTTYTMVTHFDRLISPSSIDQNNNTWAKMDFLVCHVFTFHSSLISLHLV